MWRNVSRTCTIEGFVGGEAEEVEAIAGGEEAGSGKYECRTYWPQEGGSGESHQDRASGQGKGCQ